MSVTAISTGSKETTRKGDITFNSAVPAASKINKVGELERPFKDFTISQLNPLSTQASVSTEILEKKSVVNRDSYLYTKLLLGEEYEPSQSYIRLKVAELINGTLIYLNKWIEYGTEDSYIYISKIGQLLTKYSKPLSRSNESRLLTGTLQLILNEHSWEKYSAANLKTIKLELERFASGYVSKEDIQIFNKQLFRAGISPFN